MARFFLVVLVYVLFVTSLGTSHPLLSKSRAYAQGICPDEPQCETCCSTGAETFGCCPTEDGVCCEDMKHCCPKDYSCNMENTQCVEKDTNLLLIHQTYLHSQGKSPLLQDHTCNDSVSVCPDDYTCCELKDHTGLGCCKGAKSVCCDDKVHCCPENTICDPENRSCKKKDTSFRETYTPSPRSIVCPDGKTSCTDGSTCCELIVPGTWGCCPSPGALCCPDKTHCCPHGYSCDPNSDNCGHSDLSIPFLAKASLLTHPLKNVCSDGITVCPLNDTCCVHPDRSWACCPTPNAVCCSDGHHCCPEKHTCDMIDFTCKKTTTIMKTSNHQLLPGLKVALEADTNILYKSLFDTKSCPGGKYACKTDQTCCDLGSGTWACCHGNEAVCCLDKEHCCPKDFKCKTGGKCIRAKKSSGVL